MTFQRLINRNGLKNGNYDDAGDYKLQFNIDDWGLIKTQEEFDSIMAPHWREELRRFETRIKFFLGDLRRFEKDTIDEGSTCKYIAHRTGLDEDVVAAVLKEFMNW